MSVGKDLSTLTRIERSCFSSFLIIIDYILPVPGDSWEAAMSCPRLMACVKSDFNLKFDGNFLSLPGYSKMSSLAALLIIISSQLAWLLFAADSIDFISSISSLMTCASSTVLWGFPLVVADVRMRPPWKVEWGLGAGVKSSLLKGIKNPETSKRIQRRYDTFSLHILVMLFLCWCFSFEMLFVFIFSSNYNSLPVSQTEKRLIVLTQN